jgi:ribosomal protein S11
MKQVLCFYVVSTYNDTIIKIVTIIGAQSQIIKAEKMTGYFKFKT